MTKMTNMKRRGYIYKHMMQVIDAYIYSTVSLYPTLLIHRIGEKSESNYKTIKESKKIKNRTFYFGLQKLISSL